MTQHPSPGDADRHVAILRVRGILLVTTGPELHDASAIRLQAKLMDRVRETGARGVVIDVSSLEVIDSYITRLLGDLASAVRYMGARCFVVGLRPAVALTLVEMGIDFEGIETALSLDLALASIETTDENS